MRNRITSLKNSVQNSTPGICPERALLWTSYFKKKDNLKKPLAIQIAEATQHVLLNKSILIYPNERIVGNYTSKRIGGIIYPELAGVAALGEIYSFQNRKVNPLKTSGDERWKLISILPFWYTRNITYR